MPNAKRSTQFTYGTLNVKCLPQMPQNKVVHDVTRASTLADVILWQEIEIERYKKALIGLGDGWRHAHIDLEAPISWQRDQFRKRAEGTLELHPGRALTTPNRWVTWVELIHKESERAFIFMNTHYISGAWNGKVKLHKRWRQEMWSESWQKQRDLVSELSHHGAVILGGGDFNRLAVLPFNSRTSFALTRSIDQLFLTQPHVLQKGIKRVSLSLATDNQFFSDHNMKLAAVRW